jgi:hypothetical protein
MSKLASSASQHRYSGGGAGHNLRMFGTERFHLDGWQEPYESRDSRTDLSEPGGEIPPGYSTRKKSRTIIDPAYVICQ